MEINFNSGSKSNKKGSGIIACLLLLVIGTILLWWNEGNNVRNIKTITQMEKEVVEISSEKVTPENDGKLVATNGSLVVEDETVNDNEFTVSMKTPHLKRVVEMYQWKEDEDTDDNGHKSYSYKRVWDESVINSSSFHDSGHSNPNSMPYKSNNFYASSVKVGAYNLSREQIEGMYTNAEYDVPAEVAIEGYHKSGVYITNSANLDNPAIGDVRITWRYNDWKEASVLAVTSNNSFKDFVSDAGVHINRVDEGLLTSKELIQNQEDENNMFKWIMRAVGSLLILFGYLSIVGPIQRLANKVPVLGGLVGWVLGAIAFLVAVIHSLLIIIIAWFRYRPVLAVLLLAVVIAAIVGIIVLIKSKKNKEQPAQ